MVQEDSEIILVGDTNYDLMDNYVVYDNSASNLKEAYGTFRLEQLIKDPTRVTLSTSSLIDHLATSQPISVSVAGVHKIWLSDHYMVFCVRKF